MFTFPRNTFQASYPIIIITLVALGRSTIDNGGLSQLHQAHRENANAVEEGRDGTIVFHNSPFHSSTGGEITIDGEPAANRRCKNLPELSMSEGVAKVVSAP